MKALNYFRKRDLPFWKIEDRAGKKVAEYTGGNQDEAEEELEDILDDLEPGRYTLKVQAGKNSEAGASQLTFSVKDADRQAPASRGGGMAGGADFYQTFLTEMRAQARREAQFEKRLEKLEDLVSDIRVELKKLTDDDPENDKPALEKVGELVTSFGNLASGLKALNPKA